MIQLSELQADSLREICNIGVGRAAKQLSHMLSDHIEMSVPEVQLKELYSMGDALGLSDAHATVCIYQKMNGDFNGKTLLLFHGADGQLLIDSILASTPSLSVEEHGRINHEAMIEIGNVIISSCVCALAELLGDEINLSAPYYTEGNMDTIISTCFYDDVLREDLLHTLAVATSLKASSQFISGTVVIAFSVDSLNKVFHRIDEILNDS